jgi:acetolactate synthase-1/2/3 large subunit
MNSVILIGAGCSQQTADYLCGLGVPVLTTWQAIDRVPEDSPVYCGRPGIIGQRAANIIQQSADAVYIFGARMDGEQLGHRLDNFAPHALKYIYDIDEQELTRFEGIPQWRTHKVDLSQPINITIKTTPAWLKKCKGLYNKLRYELDGSRTLDAFVDPYYFVNRLSDACQEGEIVVPSSSGMQSCAMMQAFKVKRNQKVMLCNTIGAMGFEPMAIGAALATGKRVIVTAGDGGFYLNMQELEVVHRLDLPIKYFVFCNGGYGSITTMQDARFNLRVGGDKQSGFTLPDLARVAAVWGFAYHEINSNAQMDTIQKVVEAPHAAIVRVNTSLAFRYATRVNSSLHGNTFTVDDMADMTPKMEWKGLL